MREASGKGPRSASLVALACAVALVAGCQALASQPTPAPPAAVTSPTAPAATEPATTATTRATSAPATTATAEPAATATQGATAAATAVPVPTGPAKLEVQEYDVPPGSHPHDVAPAADGGVWYTAQYASALGYLDPATGEIEEIPLGEGSSPHGVIVGPDGAAWVTDSGLNAMVRVDAKSREVTRYELPAEFARANLNTAVFGAEGRLWFTGQSGVYGALDPATGEMQVWEAPEGRGPYGITATGGKVYYASLAGSYLGQIDPETGAATVLEPPTAAQGARRAWADSKGAVWVSEWNAGQLGRFDPATGEWSEWPLPGEGAQAYAVYVDWQDKVWLSDFGNNTLVRFDPETEQFESVALPSPDAAVRQIHGRPGEVWGAGSAVDKLIVLRVR
jgi:virginiamycin B lyase